MSRDGNGPSKSRCPAGGGCHGEISDGRPMFRSCRVRCTGRGHEHRRQVRQCHGHDVGGDRSSGRHAADGHGQSDCRACRPCHGGEGNAVAGRRADQDRARPVGHRARRAGQAIRRRGLANDPLLPHARPVIPAVRTVDEPDAGVRGRLLAGQGARPLRRRRHLGRAVPDQLPGHQSRRPAGGHRDQRPVVGQGRPEHDAGSGPRRDALHGRPQAIQGRQGPRRHAGCRGVPGRDVRAAAVHADHAQGPRHSGADGPAADQPPLHPGPVAGAVAGRIRRQPGHRCVHGRLAEPQLAARRRQVGAGRLHRRGGTSRRGGQEDRAHRPAEHARAVRRRHHGLVRARAPRRHRRRLG